MVNNLHLVVSGIPQNQLRTLKWDLGTCLPGQLAHRINSIFKHQNQITSISLITDSDCKVNKHRSCSINLVQLSKLRSLSWKGLKRYDDFESVRGFIAAHGARLRTLHLDLIGWDSARLAWTRGFRQKSPPDTGLPENFFAQCVLGLRHEELRTPLPALQRLCLSQVSFSPMEIELVDALNVGKLQALQLTNCPGTFRFLRQIVRAGVPLKLKLLELTFNPEKLNQITDETQDNIAGTVKTFLEAFSGLTDLYLMLPSIVWDSIRGSITHHSATLRRLITHSLERTEYGGYEDGELFSSTYDHPSPAQTPGLEFFGASISLEHLAGYVGFDSVRQSPNLKIIHLRASGPMISEQGTSQPPSSADGGLYKVAQWAFGPEGLLGLKVLAYGDFSYDGYYNRYNILLCRDGDSYTELTVSNVRYWDLVREKMDVLGACAFDELIIGRGLP
ncbi:hypothetical protein BO94DRAFT_563475 [Aspergillus sclerotioniger CBS 115572]|uniref:F-box domain protein n=1 Tax=Aspergillus sclerotioniger CBS 115572 TaxID=1450535 RepID=A0A317X5R9_9EURO|nr:hypothetical protein BO94DRAFT_563475 [Aspergillus sclerotioniger CBS 115572]PWY93923.1 hypothetical protein BO94DRAFT_563475 [Aspergillus sclerotioniger CBS 115572]